MQAEAFHLIFFYFSRKDCSQGEAVGSLVHGPEKMSCGVQVTVIILHLHNETPLFDFLVPSRSLGHLHSGHSFFFLSFQDMSFNCEPSSEYSILYEHLMCLSANTFALCPVYLPTERLVFPDLNFKLKMEYARLLFSRITVF